MLEAFIVGFVAGLAASIPVGAAGITLMEVSFSHGFLWGAVSGCGIAFVDATFATIAVAVGQPAADHLEPYRAWISVGGGLVIAAIGALAFRAEARRAAAERAGGASEADGASAVPAPKGGLVRVTATLALLTAVNPLNVAFFVAVVVSAGRETFSGFAPCAAFVAGVTLACLVWMTLVAWLASHGARNAGAAIKRRLSRWGQGIVLSLGIGMSVYGGWLLWRTSH